eukprot:GHVQ01038899.1.p1 GENE.GHVQ01038899.1~~GHVQ01038899.1.p1  ORF type:complete len:150 (-),score=28.13 GHVQ01038899.1:170-619(-)
MHRDSMEGSPGYIYCSPPPESLVHRPTTLKKPPPAAKQSRADISPQQSSISSLLPPSLPHQNDAVCDALSEERGSRCQMSNSGERGRTKAKEQHTKSMMGNDIETRAIERSSDSLWKLTPRVQGSVAPCGVPSKIKCLSKVQSDINFCM